MSRARAAGTGPSVDRLVGPGGLRGADGDLPLPLRADAGRGPWSHVQLWIDGPRSGRDREDLRPPVDAWVCADPTPGPAGSVRVAADQTGAGLRFPEASLRLLASPPAWPGTVSDLAPGAPAGDAAAFGQALEDVQLASCYAAALAMAEQRQVGRICFGPLGRGEADPALGFPPDRAAKIALGHAVGHFARRPSPAFPATAVFLVNEEESRVWRELIDTRARWAGARRRA